MKKFALLLFLGIFPFLLNAQPPKPNPEKMDKEKITQMQAKDIAMWLNLQGDTKDRFVGDYTSFKKEIAKVAKRTVRPESAESEDDIEKAITNNFEVSEQILQIRKKYYQKYREYLQPSQIRLVYHLENEAGRRMMESLHRPGGPDMPDGPGKGPEPPCGAVPEPMM